MEHYVLRRQSLGCLESRFLQLQNGPLFQDLKLRTFEGSDLIRTSKFLMASISQKIFSELSRLERCHEVKICKISWALFQGLSVSNAGLPKLFSATM